MAKKNSTAPKKAMIFNSVLMINTNNVVSLINSLPKSKMSESSFNDYMENNFYFGGKFHGNDFNSGSHYSTVVRQLGLYHIYENEYIPRFYTDVDAQTVELFLKYWLKLYIAPNPTSQSNFRKSVVQPKFVLKEIIQFIENNQSITNIYEIIENLYGVEFSRNDKNQLPSVINSYSDCIDVDKNGNVTLRPNYKQVMNEINELIDNPNRYFEHFGKGEKPQSKIDSSLQKIYYGAPGTGKSNIIKDEIKKEKYIRTTFHPDSDYSTFVGCYKPTMKGNQGEVLSITELKKKLFDIKLKGEAYPCQRFGALYWNSLKSLSTQEIKDILSECGFTEAFNVEIAKGISVGKEMSTNTEDRIVYEFIEQAFLKAYIQAWKFYDESNEDVKKQFLVIEEINRGNCAQIFGDLFQLLDRNSYGFSDYPIHADNDMKKQLAKAFKGLNISDENKARINAYYKDDNDDKDYVKQVLEGEILLLPNNLYIWATMNTSDQSLFPIDSAFKRRWDWQYMPIKNEGKNHKIVVDKATYDWYAFMEFVNDRIENVTDSEDKQIGYWFAKAIKKNDRMEISAETLVSKVIFYLWNDVFKDYAHNDKNLFNTKNHKYKFREFYHENGKVNNIMLKQFLDELGLKDETPQTKVEPSAEDNQKPEQPAGA